MNDAAKITGADAVKAAFFALPTKLKNKIVRKGMTATGRIVRSQAIADAPVGDPKTDPHSGAFKASIVARRPKKARRGQARREIAATVKHAHFVELGTVKMTAQHMLRGALEKQQTAVIAALSDSVREGIKEAGNGR